MIDEIIQNVCLVLGVIIVFAVRQRVRAFLPKRRFVVGLAGIIFAIIAAVVMIKFLPLSQSGSISLFIYGLNYVALGMIGGMLAFSLAEIAGGSIRLLKRR
ncbi:hypothetical protein [Erythrobacter sp. R86502]|uniref:hypothetical protein n=1 Tax=Erythrobacter sp. R86502 TaxID=3093846 RepID=UPI0036D2C3E2